MQRRLVLRRGLAWALGVMGTPLLGAQPDLFSAADLAHAALLRDQALLHGGALELLTSLTQEVGARPAGSPADAKAVAWAQRQCQALGLQQVRAEPLQFQVWQRGPASATLLAPERFDLVMAALGNSVGTPEAGITAELAWYDSFDALKADTSDRARGRIVFIDQRTERSRDGAGYGRAVPARFGSAAEAARRGALAVVIRSIGTGQQRVAHTGAMRYDDDGARIPALAVSVPDADRLVALHAAPQQGPLRLQLQVANRLGVDVTSHNVIAEVPGTDLADEVVLLSAHLDSWDMGEGAADNAAGVAIVCSAAGLIARAGLKPRRTVRVVLFANEENGFDGAHAYSQRYAAQRHQLVSESDFGAGAIDALRSRVQASARPAFEAMAEVLAPLGIPLQDNNGTPGPDAALLMRRHRWPALQLSQDGSSYFDVHHTAHDTLDRLDTRALPQNVAAWAVVAWLAAQSPLSF